MEHFLGKKSENTDTRLWQEIVIVCLTVIICGNLMTGIQGFLVKGGGVRQMILRCATGRVNM